MTERWRYKQPADSVLVVHDDLSFLLPIDSRLLPNLTSSSCGATPTYIVSLTKIKKATSVARRQERTTSF